VVRLTDFARKAASASVGVPVRQKICLFVGVVCCCVVVEPIVTAGVRQYEVQRAERSTIEAELSQETYRDAEWARAYWEEITRYAESWDPYIGYRVKDFRGRFINVEGGIRRTSRMVHMPAASRTIWVFGGSAVWGHGVRDEGTLPSHLARIAAEEQNPIAVENNGESGWVNWQGVAFLLQRLADGGRPDVVVFYSGVNEMLSARRWPELRRPIWDANLIPDALDEHVLARRRPLARLWQHYRSNSVLAGAAAGHGDSHLAQLGSDELALKVAHEYLADRAVVEALGRAYGFSALFVWQSTVAAKGFLTGQERSYAGWLPREERTDAKLAWWEMDTDLRRTYQAAKDIVIARGVLDLDKAFQGMTDTAFIDWMHPTEAGNKRIARALYPAIAERLRHP
jgi:lysophospholipase L1-like esterase